MVINYLYLKDLRCVVESGTQITILYSEVSNDCSSPIPTAEWDKDSSCCSISSCRSPSLNKYCRFRTSRCSRHRCQSVCLARSSIASRPKTCGPRTRTPLSIRCGPRQGNASQVSPYNQVSQRSYERSLVPKLLNV